MRKKIPKEKHKKTVSFAITPEIYELWKEYCLNNNIENYSDYIEKLILEKIKQSNI